tara:strand:- start:24691 stop:27318 length:2628 start_codon:yes stop_codon:yes gene_type:complete
MASLLDDFDAWDEDPLQYFLKIMPSPTGGTGYPGVDIGGVLYPAADYFPNWGRFYDQEEIISTQGRLNELHDSHRPPDWSAENYDYFREDYAVDDDDQSEGSYGYNLRQAKDRYNKGRSAIYGRIASGNIRSASTVAREVEKVRLQFGLELETAIEDEVERAEQGTLKREEREIKRAEEEEAKAAAAEKARLEEEEREALEDRIRKDEEDRKAAAAEKARLEEEEKARLEEEEKAAADDGATDDAADDGATDDAADDGATDEEDAFEKWRADLPVDSVTGKYDTNPIDPLTGERMHPDLTEGLGGPSTGASFAGGDDWWVDRWRALQAGDTADLEALDAEKANYSCAPGFSPQRQNGVWVCVNLQTNLPESFATDESAASAPEPPPPVDEVLNLSEEEIDQAIIDRSLTDEEIEVLIEADRLTDQQMHNLRVSGKLTEEQIEDFNDKSILDAIDDGVMGDAAIENLARNGHLSEAVIQELIRTGRLPESAIQALLDTGQYDEEEIDVLLSGGGVTEEEEEDQPDEETITEEELNALIAEGTLSDEEINGLIADGQLTEGQLRELILTQQLSGDNIDSLLDAGVISYDYLDSVLDESESATLSDYFTLEELEGRLGQPLTPEQLEEYGYESVDDTSDDTESYDDLQRRLDEAEEELANSRTQYEADASRNQRDQTRERLDEYFADAQPSGPRTGTTSEFQVRGGANPISSLIASQQGPGSLNKAPYIPTYTPSYSDWEAPMSIDKMGEYRGPGPVFEYDNSDPLWYSEEDVEEEDEYYEGEEDEYYEWTQDEYDAALAANPNTEEQGDYYDDGTLVGTYNQGGQVMQPQQSTMFNQNSILDQRPGQTNQGILGALNFQTNVAPFQNAFRPNVTRNN